MKIVLATPMYPPEIAEPASYVKEVALRLRTNHEITVVAYASTSEHVSGVTLITISKKNPLPIRFIKYAITLYHASKGADLIYAQSGMVASIPAIMVGQILKIPVVLRYMEDEPWKRATLLRLTDQSPDAFLKQTQENLFVRFLILLQSFVLRKAEYVITPSAYQAKNIFLAYNVPEQKTTVIHNPVEKEEVLPFAENVVPRQIVLSSKLVRWSGVDNVLRAVLELKKEFPDVRLLIAGEGIEKEGLKDLAGKLSISENVAFLGQISRAEAWHIRKSSEVFIESTIEGAPPDAVLWSLSAGIPVIASNVPGIQEAIIHENSGLLVEAGNSSDLADAIKKVFMDENLRMRLIESGKNILAEKFSWDAHIRALNALFASISKHE